MGKSISCKQLWQNIEKLRELVAMEVGPFAALMGMSATKYLTLKKKRQSPSLTEATRLVMHLGVSMDSLTTGDFKIRRLRRDC